MSYFDNPLTEQRQREQQPGTPEGAVQSMLGSIAPALTELLIRVQDELKDSPDKSRDVHEDLIGIPRQEFAATSASLLSAAAEMKHIDVVQLFRVIQEFPWLPGCFTEVVTSFFLAGREHAKKEAESA